jgi:hypothetical protein
MAVLYRGPDASIARERYAVVRTEGDDRLMEGAEDAWGGATAIAWGPDRYRTTFRALAAPRALLVRFDCRDERPWSVRSQRDAELWNEEVVEIFLDPCGSGRDYAEIEINPANVVCDLRIRETRPGLVGEIDWDFPGLVTRVRPWRAAGGGPDGWMALASFPWDGFRALSPQASACVPPASGATWRFNVFRIKRPHGAGDPERDAVYAAWSVPDGPSFHVPDAFGTMVFV